MLSLVRCWKGTSFSSTLLLVLLAVTATARELPKSDDKIRPDMEEEGPSFWREYAKNDLARQLKVANNNGLAKNVILFVGDGMGVQTVTMSRIYMGQKKGKSGEEEELIWESFPSVGLSKTYNTDYQVADSAGTATAIFSGVKTNLGLVGLDNRVARNSCDPEVYEKAKLKGIMHWAMDAGKETGIVTTTRITHATPSSAYAHSADREWETDSHKDYVGREECHDDIAKQLVHGEAGSKINVIFGGGKKHFLLANNVTGGNRKDGDLLAEYKLLKEQQNDRSFTYMETAKELRKWEADGTTDYVMGLFALDHLKYMTDRKDGDEEEEPTLSEMSAAAVRRLKRAKNGFFLLVEGGRIDHAHHDNFAHRAFEETMEMEKTVRAILKLVDIKETLIIVTADHSHSVTMNGYPKRGNNILGSFFNDPNSMSPYGNGKKLAYATVSYANGRGFFDHFTGDSVVPWTDFRDMVNFEKPDFRHPAMMPPPDKSETHGGEDVPIYAIGPMAHLLTGVHEQSFIAHVIAFSSCTGDYKDDCERPGKNGATDLLTKTSYQQLLVLCLLWLARL